MTVVVAKKQLEEPKTMLKKFSTPSRPLLIAWAPFSPTLIEVGSLVGGRVVFLNVLFGRKLAAPLRYPFLALRTLSLLSREKPRVVVAQNPPIFLPLLLVLARRFYQFRLVVDHHAVWSMKTLRQPFLSQAIAVLESYVSKKADSNMSPNYSWTRELRARGATDAFTYHDFIPRSAATTGGHNKQWATFSLPPFRFLTIAAHGGHPQELLEEEIAAVGGFEDYLLVITGKREKLGQRIARLNPPSNVVYPGYIDDAHYEALKRNADVALSLSTELNTVPHAIHEYLAYGVPTIVLKDSLLRSLFDGAIIEIDDARPETVRRALAMITEDSSFRNHLRENINRNYETRFKMHLEEESKLRRVLSS
jgi:glycosyl transferase family 1/glycosyl transferase family 4